MKSILTVCLLSLLLQGCASVDAWIRTKVYRPTPVEDAERWRTNLDSSPGVSTIEIPLAGGERLTVLKAPAQEGKDSAVRVLYLHGTFRHALQNLPKTLPMRAAGLDVYVVDYRGWGRSSVRLPDEASIHEDAWTAWQALHPPSVTDEGQKQRWVIYGHSMGTAVAARLARQLSGHHAYCALVLESALTSFSDVAWASAGPIGTILLAMGSQRMALSADIGHVDPPVWFIHGARDTTIPPSLGRRAFELAPAPKHWLELSLSHSNLHQDTSGAYAAVWRDVAANCARTQP
ncbi:MAG: alpha/beta fold hydrolase [Hydrogenophaga sp.]|nr:alpha/beta fold hydrolase [Hydrogenophaga sp.]